MKIVKDKKKTVILSEEIKEGQKNTLKIMLIGGLLFLLREMMIRLDQMKPLTYADGVVSAFALVFVVLSIMLFYITLGLESSLEYEDFERKEQIEKNEEKE